MQDSVLETILVVDSTNKMTAQNLWDFIVNFAPKLKFAKNWKS
jgi:hypothetical protein